MLQFVEFEGIDHANIELFDIAEEAGCTEAMDLLHDAHKWAKSKEEAYEMVRKAFYVLRLEHEDVMKEKFGKKVFPEYTALCKTRKGRKGA